jgi:hypothetical protein
LHRRLGLGRPAPILPGHLAGLPLSTAGSSAIFGVATDSRNTDTMALPAAFTKPSSVWAAVTCNGSLDTGSVSANTRCHVHPIKRPDTSGVDLLISTSVTEPALPGLCAMAPDRIVAQRRCGP